MSLRKRYLPVVAVLGAGALGGGAVAIMPALATAGTSPSSEVKLEVNENCYLSNWPCWNVVGNPPADNPVSGEIKPFTIAQGGTISFEDKGVAETDVIWKGTAPSCTPEVPSKEEATWNSTCTFANAGTYEFESQGLFDADGVNYTQYKVIVEGTGGGTTSTSTSTTMTTTAHTTTSMSTSTTMTTTAPTTTMPGKSSHSSGSPLVGGSKALTLAGSQHGSTVHGSLKVSKAGAGGRLEVSILAAGASRHSKQMSVGRLVRSSLKAGSVSFAVPLSAAGKAALRRDGHLSLTVKITLTPRHGAAVKITHVVVVHA